MNPESSTETVQERLLDAALPHVPFEGWSEVTLQAAIAESGVAPALARALFPRGGVDMALAYHRRGDRRMVEALAGQDLAALRFRDRIARAVELRLQMAEREVVRRGMAILSLPRYAPEGARAVWGTADAIWTALGDKSRDVNWYTKRATLSAVYAATVVYWLGDDSEGHQATRDFLDRRIGEVMQFEGFKARMRENPLAKALKSGPFKILERIRAPQGQDDLPGHS